MARALCSFYENLKSEQFYLVGQYICNNSNYEHLNNFLYESIDKKWFVNKDSLFYMTMVSSLQLISS